MNGEPSCRQPHNTTSRELATVNHSVWGLFVGQFLFLYSSHVSDKLCEIRKNNQGKEESSTDLIVLPALVQRLSPSQTCGKPLEGGP